MVHLVSYRAVNTCPEPISFGGLGLSVVLSLTEEGFVTARTRLSCLPNLLTLEGPCSRRRKLGRARQELAYQLSYDLEVDGHTERLQNTYKLR